MDCKGIQFFLFLKLFSYFFKKILVVTAEAGTEAVAAAHVLDGPALVAVELLRDPDHDLDEEVAAAGAVPAYSGQAFAAQPDSRAGLCPGIDLKAVRPVEAGDGDLAAEHGVRDADYLCIIQVHALAAKLRMLGLLDDYQQVAVRAVVRCGMAFAAYGELHALLDAGGNLDLYGLPPPYEARAAAGTARVGNNLAFALALRAGGIRHRAPEERIGDVLDLSGALAGGAGLDVRRVARALALAVRAGTVALDGDLFLDACGDLLEGEAHARADVPAAENALLVMGGTTHS